MTRRLIRLLSLIAPAAVIAVAAAVTPLSEFSTNQGDVGYYLGRAQAVLEGQVPYRDVPFEYPPLALLPMVVPLVAGPTDLVDVAQYRWRFAAWEALLAIALAVVLTRVAGLGGWIGGQPGTPVRVGVGWRLALLSIGAALALTWRFDLFPAVLVAVAVWAGLARRPTIAGVALGLGVATKLYPVALIPAVAAGWIVRRDVPAFVKFSVGGMLAGAAVLLPFLALAGPAALGFLGYQAERGLQVESIGGGLAVLAGLLTGAPPVLTFGFASVEVEGSLADALLGVLPLCTIIGFALVGWLGWRKLRSGVRADAVVSLVCASLLVLLVTSKVYSIQYVVWILPFLALVRGRMFWVGVAIAALTMPIHPLLYAELVRQEPLPILVLNLRNALVVVLTCWLPWSLRPSASDGAPREMTRPANAETSTAASGL